MNVKKRLNKKLRGKFKGYGLLKAFLEERAKELEREEKKIAYWSSRKSKQVE